MTPKRIALFRLSALGDVVLMIPLIKTLQATWPDCKITWITSPLAYRLLAGLPGVEFCVIPKPRGLREYWSVGRKLTKNRYDILLAMQASLRANLLYPWIRAPIKLGFDNQRARDGHRWFVNQQIPFAPTHLLDGFLSFAEQIGAHPKTITWDLPLTPADWAYAKAQTPATDFIAINPHASKHERCWPTQRWIELIGLIEKRWQMPIVLTGANNPAEVQTASAITQNHPQVINLVGKTNPKECAAVLGRACALIAPDTGPLHIAVAMNTPVLGLYAVAPSALSGPYLQSEFVIDKYPQAITACLHKDPKTIPWGTRVHDSRAMALITVQDVFTTLEKMLAR